MTEPVRRAAEIEGATNLYFIHPLSAWIVPHCAARRITPNQVSIAGMGCGIAAGIAYHFYPHTACVFLGFALMIAWHVFDGADGQLARLTNTFSELGKLIDGICDYVTFAAVYLGIGLTLATIHGNWIFIVIALSGIAHAVQAAAYELQRQYYNVYGLGRTSTALPDANAPAAPGLAGMAQNAYAHIQRLIGGDAAAFHARLAANPTASREKYCATFAPVIRRWSLLSANTRTIAIFICTLSGVPLLYFFFEIIILSAALAALLADQRSRYATYQV